MEQQFTAVNERRMVILRHKFAKKNTEQINLKNVTLHAKRFVKVFVKD